MRRCFIKVVLILIFCTGFLQAGLEFIHNQNSPVLKKRARVLKIKKIISLEGNSDDYQLKDPSSFDIADDGTIFVKDWNRALYKFSQGGHFIDNLLKKGEGPGELKYLYKYILLDDRIIMFCHFPNKIVETDFEGKMLREYRIPNGGVVLLYGVDKSVFFFSIREINDFQKNLTKEFRDFSTRFYFYRWEKGKKDIVKGEIFYTEQSRFKRFGEKGIMGAVSPMHAFSKSNMANESVYFINVFDYKIKKINISDLKLDAEFGRPFSNVKFFFRPEHIERLKKEKKAIKSPEKKFFSAVQKIFNRGKELWVITSKYEKGKGILVDVFTDKGIYKDKFFLPLPEITSPHLPTFNVVKDRIIILGVDEDENHVVNVYKILN